MPCLGLPKGGWDQATSNGVAERDEEWALRFGNSASTPSKTSGKFLTSERAKQRRQPASTASRPCGTNTQPVTFTTSGSRQVHARTSNEGDKQPQSCRVGEPFTTKQKVCGQDIHLQQIYHEVDARHLVILMELIRNGPLRLPGCSVHSVERLKT